MLKAVLLEAVLLGQPLLRAAGALHHEPGLPAVRVHKSAGLTGRLTAGDKCLGAKPVSVLLDTHPDVWRLLQAGGLVVHSKRRRGGDGQDIGCDGRYEFHDVDSVHCILSVDTDANQLSSQQMQSSICCPWDRTTILSNGCSIEF